MTLLVAELDISIKRLKFGLKCLFMVGAPNSNMFRPINNIGSSLVYIYISIERESLNFRECVEDPRLVESCSYSLLLVDSKSARIQKCRFQLFSP